MLFSSRRFILKKILCTVFILLLIPFYFLFQKEPLTYSFYHWDNSYKQKNISSQLYIKVLDIDYSNKLEVIKTKFYTKPKDGFIPVIYITNEAMKLIPFQQLSTTIINSLKKLPYNYNEVQFDCDWSLTSRANYFDMLATIKKNLNKKLSATIRLHQIKYSKKTGVPPVDYGVLMYYNMSNIGDYDSRNSILDNCIAKKYHYNFDIYPLKLKLALPLYSQAIQFRDKKPLDIFEGVQENDFVKEFKPLGNNRFEVVKSRYFKGRYIYRGDVFRFEDSKLKDLKVALEDFLHISSNRSNEIIFYTLKYKNKYNLEQFIKGE